MTPDTATGDRGSYDAPMERLLLLWDEIDDLVGTSRYMFRNKAMSFWSQVRKQR